MGVKSLWARASHTENVSGKMFRCNCTFPCMSRFGFMSWDPCWLWEHFLSRDLFFSPWNPGMFSSWRFLALYSFYSELHAKFPMESQQWVSGGNQRTRTNVSALRVASCIGYRSSDCDWTMCMQLRNRIIDTTTVNYLLLIKWYYNNIERPEV